MWRGQRGGNYTYGGSLGVPTGDVARQDNSRVREFQEEILRKQREEFARVEKEAHDRHMRVEEFLRMERQEVRSDAENRKRLTLKRKIPQELSKYAAEQAEEQQRLQKRYESIAVSIDRINVPSPIPIPRHYGSVLLLGAGDSPEEAQAAYKEGLLNPFTNDPYNGIFAFGDKGFMRDLNRAIADHVLADNISLSQRTLGKLGELRGATIKTVVGHSNGATVAEVLIRKGVIKGVEKFLILGGDRSLMNLESLQELASEKHIEIFVYANKGDIVPMTHLGWQIRAMVEQVGPLQQYKLAEGLTYQMLGLRRPDPATQSTSTVRVQLFSIPPAWTSVADKHIYANYHRLINSRRLQGCLESAGATDARCRF